MSGPAAIPELETLHRFARATAIVEREHHLQGAPGEHVPRDLNVGHITFARVLEYDAETQLYSLQPQRLTLDPEADPPAPSIPLTFEDATDGSEPLDSITAYDPIAALAALSADSQLIAVDALVMVADSNIGRIIVRPGAFYLENP